MSNEEQLRQRIQSLRSELADCREPAQRERLIEQLLDTQDQLMFLNAAPNRRPVPLLRAV